MFLPGKELYLPVKLNLKGLFIEVIIASAENSDEYVQERKLRSSDSSIGSMVTCPPTKVAEHL